MKEHLPRCRRDSEHCLRVSKKCLLFLTGAGVKGTVLFDTFSTTPIQNDLLRYVHWTTEEDRFLYMRNAKYEICDAKMETLPSFSVPWPRRSMACLTSFNPNGWVALIPQRIIFWNTVLWQRAFFLPNPLTFLPKYIIVWEKTTTLGRKEIENRMREFDYSKLAERTWDNEIISYISKIHEYKGKWRRHAYSYWSRKKNFIRKSWQCNEVKIFPCSIILTGQALINVKVFEEYLEQCKVL